MEHKKIDFNRTVFELCRENPELPEILAGLGFTDIVKSGMLATAGRFMTLSKGATMKKISLDMIRETLVAKGYDING